MCFFSAKKSIDIFTILCYTLIIEGGENVFYLRIRGGTTFISSASNLYYLCDNCLKWFFPSVVVSIYTYPDSVLVASISSGKITFHRLGEFCNET